MELNDIESDILKNRSATYGPKEVGARLNLAEFKTKRGIKMAYVAILPKKFAGERKRKQFNNLSEAVKWIDDEIKRKETTTATVSEAADFNYCLPRLREKNVSIGELLNFYEKRFIPDSTRLRISEIQERLLNILDARSEKISDHTRRKFVTMGTRIENDFENAFIDEITANRAYNWAISATTSEGDHRWSPKTRKHHWNHLKRLIDFAISERALKANPLDELSKEKLKGIIEIKLPLPEILTVGEAKAIITATQEHCPPMLPCTILCLFEGLRQHEAWQLKGSDFDFDEGTVEISERIAKTRSLRFVELSDASKAWLEVCTIPKKGPLLPFGTKSAEGRWTAILKKAGVAKRNALRHTAASVMFKLRGDNFTKGQLGHVENSDMLFRHYKRAMKTSEAEAIISILPPDNISDGTIQFPREEAV